MGNVIQYLNRTVRKVSLPTRQNHALEHATVAVLLRRAEHPLHVMGRATSTGFYIHADVDADEVESAAREALRRMQKGDGYLAVSPFCGTNLVIAGALAALACFVVLGKEKRASKLPVAVTAATLAVLVAQPLGALAQQHVTTSAEVEDIRIIGVNPVGSPSRRMYKVETMRVGAYQTSEVARKAA